MRKLSRYPELLVEMGIPGYHACLLYTSNPKNLGVNIKTLLYQVPGGMLSNLTSQLKEQHAEDKFYDVLEEVPRVRKDLGEPPLVTPSSQILSLIHI